MRRFWIRMETTMRRRRKDTILYSTLSIGGAIKGNKNRRRSFLKFDVTDLLPITFILVAHFLSQLNQSHASSFFFRTNDNE